VAPHLEGLPHQSLVVRLVVKVLLRGGGQAQHGVDRLHRVAPTQRLGPQQQAVDAVQHSIGDVGGL
jgi:hypothetical protein